MAAFLNIYLMGGKGIPFSKLSSSIRKTGNVMPVSKATEVVGIRMAWPALNGLRSTGKGKEAAHPVDVR